MKASLTDPPTNSGNSSDKNLKSTVRQFAVTGTLRSILRIVTSMSLVPRTVPPPSLAPSPIPELEASARVALPELRIPYVAPAVGNDARAVEAMAFGVPKGGTETKAAPVTVLGSAAIAAARSGAEHVGRMLDPPKV